MFKLYMRILSTLLVLTCSTVTYAQNCEDFFKFFSAGPSQILNQVPQSLKDSIQTLSQEIISSTERINANEAQVERSKSELAALVLETRWIERNLFRSLAVLLGGRVDAIEKFASSEQKLAKLEELAHAEWSRRNLHAYHKELKIREAIAIVEAWLRQTDRRYQELLDIQKRLKDIVCSGKACIDVLDETLMSLSNAKQAETLDLFSSSKGISFISTQNTGAAAYKMKEAGEAVQDYQNNLKKFDARFNDLSMSFSTDTLDFIFGLTFDIGFDFNSSRSIHEIEKIEPKIKEIRGALSTIHQDLKQQSSEMNKRVEEILCEIKGVCSQL